MDKKYINSRKKLFPDINRKTDKQDDGQYIDIDIKQFKQNITVEPNTRNRACTNSTQQIRSHDKTINIDIDDLTKKKGGDK